MFETCAYLIFSFPRFFEMKTVFEPTLYCGLEAITITNTTVEEDLDEMTIEEENPVTTESERENCTFVYVPRINVTELRFDPYYSSVSFFPYCICLRFINKTRKSSNKEFIKSIKACH